MLTRADEKVESCTGTFLANSTSAAPPIFWYSAIFLSGAGVFSKSGLVSKKYPAQTVTKMTPKNKALRRKEISFCFPDTQSTIKKMGKRSTAENLDNSASPVLRAV